MQFKGAPKTEVQDLPRIKERIVFLYLEKCKISKKDSAILAIDEEGIVEIPSAIISVLMLGPGTSPTHRAVELISDAGLSIVWVGENGLKYLTSGKPLTTSSALLVK